jgi:hypothetical protein
VSAAQQSQLLLLLQYGQLLLLLQYGQLLLLFTYIIRSSMFHVSL